jgi:Leucine Rich Repeat
MSTNCNNWLNVILPTLSPQANFKQCCAANSFMQCSPQGDILSIDLAEFASQITGTLPAEFSLLSRLQILRISGAKLSGPIPESFGSFNSLTFLDLSNNQLSGLVPNSLGDLLSNNLPLQTLDISGNPGLLGPLNPILLQNVKTLKADPAVLNAPPSPDPTDTDGTVVPAPKPAPIGQIQQASTGSSALLVGVVVSIVLSIIVFGIVFYLHRKKAQTKRKNRNSQFWMKGAQA